MKRAFPWLWPIVLFALSAAAEIPTRILDTRKYIAADLYDLTPDRLAESEEGRYSRNEIWIGLGSLNVSYFQAVERGVVNLPLASWLNLHGDIRNDRDRDSSTRRLVLDVTAKLLPWLWVGPSGAPPVPASDKATFAVGGAALFTNRDRTCYLLSRLVLDSNWYNDLNEQGGVRSQKVYHPQVEGRWSSGRWSFYGYLDIATVSDIRFPSAPIVQRQTSSRSEYNVHLRYAGDWLEADARWDRLVTNDAQFGPMFAYENSRSLSTTRLEGLLAPWGSTSPFRLRLELRLVDEHGHGTEMSDYFRLSRIEPGARAAGVWRLGHNVLEAGYASAVVSLSIPAEDGVMERPYQDMAYASWEYSFNPRFHLRARLTWNVRDWQFGGADGVLLVQF